MMEELLKFDIENISSVLYEDIDHIIIINVLHGVNCYNNYVILNSPYTGNCYG